MSTSPKRLAALASAALAVAGITVLAPPPPRPPAGTTSSSARSTAEAATPAPRTTRDFVELYNPTASRGRPGRQVRPVPLRDRHRGRRPPRRPCAARSPRATTTWSDERGRRGAAPRLPTPDRGRRHRRSHGGGRRSGPADQRHHGPRPRDRQPRRHAPASIDFVGLDHRRHHASRARPAAGHRDQQHRASRTAARHRHRRQLHRLHASARRRPRLPAARPRVPTVHRHASPQIQGTGTDRAPRTATPPPPRAW